MAVARMAMAAPTPAHDVPDGGYWRGQVDAQLSHISKALVDLLEQQRSLHAENQKALHDVRSNLDSKLNSTMQTMYWIIGIGVGLSFVLPFIGPILLSFLVRSPK